MCSIVPILLYFFEKRRENKSIILVHEQDQNLINIFTREILAAHFYETKKTKYRELCIVSSPPFFHQVRNLLKPWL